jgi:pentalenic acid synthase
LTHLGPACDNAARAGPIAAEDIEIGGVTIKAGEGVIIKFQSANRDASVVNVPNRLDMSRDARRHVAFG